MRLPFDEQFKLTQNWNDPCCRGSYLKFGLLGHNGEDWGLPEGTPILAPHDGICKEVADEGMFGYGKYIKIESEIEGSLLAHLSNFNISVDQQIKEGEIIGWSGNTGNSTGPHLHWGYYRIPRNRNNGFAGYIDQSDWLNSETISQPTTQEITDQTLIPLGKIGEIDYGDIELQSVRSRILAKDQANDNLTSSNNQQSDLIGQLRKDLEEYGKELSKWQNFTLVSPENMPKTAETPSNDITLPSFIDTLLKWLKTRF